MTFLLSAQKGSDATEREREKDSTGAGGCFLAPMDETMRSFIDAVVRTTSAAAAGPEARSIASTEPVRRMPGSAAAAAAAAEVLADDAAPAELLRAAVAPPSSSADACCCPSRCWFSSSCSPTGARVESLPLPREVLARASRPPPLSSCAAPPSSDPGGT